MLKLFVRSCFHKHLKVRYFHTNRSKILSISSQCDKFSERENYKQVKTFNILTRLGVLIGMSYMCYDLYQKRKFTPMLWDSILPELQAAETPRNDNNILSPRATFNFLADVAEKTAPSVVYIEIVERHPITKQTFPISNGSGFIVRADGLILTNAHVVSHHGRVIVKLYNGEEFEGTIEHFDTESDLATVRIKANNLPVLPLGQSSKLRAGEFVIAMGNPLTLSHTITAGVVSSANRQGKDLGLHRKSDYIQTDAAVNVGNSGGPLVNLDCEAIGINTMKVTEGISFAIPSDRAVDFLKRVENSQKSKWMSFNNDTPQKRKYLGITMLTLTPNIIRELQERNPDFPNVTSGVMVWRIMINSPSYEAGIKHGDVVTSINGIEIKSASDIYNLLKSEDVLSIHVIRKRKEFDFVVKLRDPVVS